SVGELPEPAAVGVHHVDVVVGVAAGGAGFLGHEGDLGAVGRPGAILEVAVLADAVPAGPVGPGHTRMEPDGQRTGAVPQHLAGGRPGGPPVVAGAAAHVALAGPVGPHHVDLVIAVALRAEGDQAAAGRPRGVEVVRRAGGQAPQPGAVGVDRPD